MNHDFTQNHQKHQILLGLCQVWEKIQCRTFEDLSQSFFTSDYVFHKEHELKINYVHFCKYIKKSGQFQIFSYINTSMRRKKHKKVKLFLKNICKLQKLNISLQCKLNNFKKWYVMENKGYELQQEFWKEDSLLLSEMIEANKKGGNNG